MHAKFSHYCTYFSKKPMLFQGEREMNVHCRIQKVYSVPGLLATIFGYLVISVAAIPHQNKRKLRHNIQPYGCDMENFAVASDVVFASQQESLTEKSWSVFSRSIYSAIH